MTKLGNINGSLQKRLIILKKIGLIILLHHIPRFLWTKWLVFISMNGSLISSSVFLEKWILASNMISYKKRVY